MKRVAFTVSCFVFTFLAIATRDATAQPFASNVSTGSLTLVSSVPTLDTYPVTEVTTSAGEFL
jgi:hypothetical protein